MLPDIWLEGQTLRPAWRIVIQPCKLLLIHAGQLRPHEVLPKPMPLKVIIFQAPQPAQQLAYAPAAAQLAFWAVSYMPYTHACITDSRA